MTHDSLRADPLLQHRPLDPITAGFGLPAAAPRLESDARFQYSFEHGNIFTGGVSGSELLLLDGETSRLDLRYHRAVNACWSWGVEGAVLAHTGGLFDRAIDDWHDWFGLPNAGRGSAPEFAVRFVYTDSARPDQAQRRLESSASGLGDVQLSAQYRGACRRNASLWRIGIKVPLADESRFLGSGTTDAFLDWQSPSLHLDRGLSAAMSVGVLVPGRTTAFAEQRAAISYGVFGMQYAFNSALKVQSQIDWHTAPFRSKLRELGHLAGIFTLGLLWQRSATDYWAISIAEDIIVDTAPDIVLRVAWTRGL